MKFSVDNRRKENNNVRDETATPQFGFLDSPIEFLWENGLPRRLFSLERRRQSHRQKMQSELKH